jgi:hypothetical protein
MKHLLNSPKLRAIMGFGALLLSAFASMATSDCSSYEPLEFERHDSFDVGQTSRRYRIYAPGAHSISLAVDDWATLTWIDAPADLLSDAGTDPVSVPTAYSLEFRCDRPCPSGECNNPCSQFVVEVARADAFSASDFTLTVVSQNVVNCDGTDEVFELKVVSE